MTIAIAIIGNIYKPQGFYLFLSFNKRTRQTNIKGLSKEIFENNTNRDLKPQKDKNTIFYAIAHKKTSSIHQAKQKTQTKTPKNTK
ncbi:hypothetical protein E5S13_002782 [Escherichia coli]|nr:hypothetical protein [Escherichia coli]